MEVHIRLYKNGTDISGGSYKTADAAPLWTPFSMTFSTYADADSARIFMTACYDNDAPIPHGNSVLYIDNLSFDGLIGTGITDLLLEENKISVYPSPASDKLTLVFSEKIGKPIDLNIFNDFGQPVFIQNISDYSRTATFDISQFSAGLYFVRITTDKQIVYYKRIIITR